MLDANSSITNKTKILAIHNILWSHYKAPIFIGLTAKLKSCNIDFYVVQLALSERSRIALKADASIHTYPYEVLFPESAIEDIGVFVKIVRLLSVVIKNKPDLIYLNGYYDIAYWVIVFYCKLKGIRVILDFESNEISRRRTVWKERLKMLFLSQCNGVVCLGKRAAEYAMKLKVSKNKILSLKNVGVDNQGLLQIFNKEFPYREQRKKELALPLFNFLYAGRFVERKNLAFFISAFDDAQKSSVSGSKWGVILSGEGDQKQYLMELVTKLGNSSIHFMDACEWFEVPIRYTLADVAVLSSTYEPFGFLTNEAMVYSMPVLVSDRCGSAEDLVINDHNGFQFDPFDKNDLKMKLIKMMENPDRFSEFGRNGKAIIDGWSSEVIVNELVQAFIKTLPHEKNLQ